MKIDFSAPSFDFGLITLEQPAKAQAENRELIHAVHAVNASDKLGQSNELTFTLDRETKRPVIRIVNRETNEVVQQIPTEQVLRLAEDLKF